MVYKVLIVDDEEPARELMLAYAQKLENLEVVEVVSNALAAKKCIEKKEVDILLTDIQMEDLTGIDLVKTLKDQPITIFTTAYSEYALEGYDLDVVDYLVKPISFQRFCKAIDKAIELKTYRSTSGQAIQNRPLQTVDTTISNDYFFVKTNRKMVKVRFAEILYVQAYGEYVKIFTQSDMLLALQSMLNMEELLPANTFVRIHRSHIVNIDHVKEIEGNEVLVSGQRLLISKRMKEGFMAFIREKGMI